MGSCSQLCRALCVYVCSDSKNMGLTRETSEVWCGTSVARLHTVPSTLFLPWPPCDVASLRTKHPATVVSMKNQTALVIPLLSFSLFCTTTKLMLGLFLHGCIMCESITNTHTVRFHHFHLVQNVTAISVISSTIPRAMWSGFLLHLSHASSCTHSFKMPKKLCFQVLQMRVVSKICKSYHACRLGYTQLTKSAP